LQTNRSITTNDDKKPTLALLAAGVLLTAGVFFAVLPAAAFASEEQEEEQALEDDEYDDNGRETGDAGEEVAQVHAQHDDNKHAKDDGRADPHDRGPSRDARRDGRYTRRAWRQGRVVGRSFVPQAVGNGGGGMSDGMLRVMGEQNKIHLQFQMDQMKDMFNNIINNLRNNANPLQVIQQFKEAGLISDPAKPALAALNPSTP
jgi:hypothetical protein